MAQASLEIHQLNVGQGDSTLIVVRDVDKLATAAAGATCDPISFLPYCVAKGRDLKATVKAALLMDGGNDCYGPDVCAYLVKVGVIDPTRVCQDNLHLMANHYHDDHQDGLRSIFCKQDAAGKIVERYRPKTLIRMEAAAARDRGMALMSTILNDIDKQVEVKRGLDRLWSTEIAFVPKGGRMAGGKRWSFPLGVGVDGIKIELRVLASDQAYFKGGALLPIADRSRKARAQGRRSENDRSVACVVEYGSFRHFLAGDIGGVDCQPSADIETPLSKALPVMLPVAGGANAAKQTKAGHCCSMKLSHHGSRTSNGEPILAALRPRMVTASAGVRQNCFLHPTAETVARLAKAQWVSASGVAVDRTLTDDAIYVTEVPKRGRIGNGRPQDHVLAPALTSRGTIVVRPIDDSIKTAQDAAATGNPIRIAVYSDGSQSPIPASVAANYALVPAAAVTAGGDPTVPVILDCALH
jgi:hypothetical protein